MSNSRLSKQRTRRKNRVRNKIRKTSNRPRLSVFRSNKHIYAQVIDDRQGRSLATASTVESQLCDDGQSGADKKAAAKVGQAIAERALEKGIKKVTLDRGVFQYHGRVAALADAARKGGLDF